MRLIISLGLLIRGCYFEEGGRIDMAMNVTEAFRKSLLTWKSWVMNKFDLERSHFSSEAMLRHISGPYPWDRIICFNL